MDEKTLKQIDEINQTLLDLAASLITIQRVLNHAGITKPQTFQDDLLQVRLHLNDCKEANRLKEARHLLVLDEASH